MLAQMESYLPLWIGAQAAQMVLLLLCAVLARAAYAVRRAPYSQPAVLAAASIAGWLVDSANWGSANWGSANWGG